MSYETSYSEMCEEGLKCCKDDERSLVRHWAYWASNDEIRREYTHDGELRKQFVPLDKNAMQQGDDGAGANRVLESVGGGFDDERITRIRAFFKYIKTYRPKEWEAVKAVIRAKGNRAEAIRILGVSKISYKFLILRATKLASSPIMYMGICDGCHKEPQKSNGQKSS